MAYRSLKSIFHAADAREHEAEYLRRVASESVLRWDFPVGEWPLFCLVTPETAKLLVEVQAREAEMARLAGSLPSQAIVQYFQELVTDEVLSTHQMEGVRSTRGEVQGTLFEILNQPARDRARSRARFAEFVGLYLDLWPSGPEKSHERPQDLDGIREIYDAVTRGEVSEDQAPDGKWFRVEGVQVVDGNTVRHSGVVTEAAIEERLRTMLVAVGDEDVPPVLRAVIGHFMFEYVHPFYDGNGRTGRYLLSQELAHALGPLTALRLSRKVSERKKAYYRAFEDVENPLNRADATLFVLPLLRMIAETQVELMEDLQERRRRLVRLADTMEELPSGVEAEHALLYVLGQAHLFASGGVSLADLGESLERSPQTARRHLKALEGRGLVASSGRPLVSRLTAEGLEMLGLEG